MIINCNDYTTVMVSVAVTFMVVILGQKVYDIILNAIKAYKSKHTTKNFFKSTKNN